MTAVTFAAKYKVCSHDERRSAICEWGECISGSEQRRVFELTGSWPTNEEDRAFSVTAKGGARRSDRCGRAMKKLGPSKYSNIRPFRVKAPGAAYLLDISTSKFLDCVKAGMYPSGHLDGRNRFWLVRELEECVEDQRQGVKPYGKDAYLEGLARVVKADAC